MNTTRTVEIEVCGDCSEDITDQNRKYHYFTCPQCLRSICRNIKNHFTVRVSDIKPHGYPRKSVIHEFSGWSGSTSGEVSEYEFRADFCEDCADRVRQVLHAAGLSKHAVAKSRYVIVADKHSSTG